MHALEVPRISVEEYLAADEAADTPHEYHDGVMMPIELGGLPHADIGANVVFGLGAALKATPCRPLVNPRVRATTRQYVYPDMAVVCGKGNVVDKAGTIDDPKVIFEILPYVEPFRKQADQIWVFSAHEGLDASFQLQSLNISLSLSDIYANVAFEA